MTADPQSDDRVPAEGSTSRSLLAEAKLADPEAWERLAKLYAPLVASWCHGCKEEAAALQAHPDLIAVENTAAAQPLLALLPDGGAQHAHRVYLVDPLGNLMMLYPLDATPKGMLQDMKRLLQLSQIG